MTDQTTAESTTSKMSESMAALYEKLRKSEKDGNLLECAKIKATVVLGLLTSGAEHVETLDQDIKADIMLTALDLLAAASMHRVTSILMDGMEKVKDVKVGVAVLGLHSLNKFGELDRQLSNLSETLLPAAPEAAPAEPAVAANG